MDGWKDKKNEKNRWMVGWLRKYLKINMDSWKDKNIEKNRWMVGWLRKYNE